MFNRNFIGNLRFNSLNSFVFVDNGGAEHVVRWSLLPAAQLVSISPDDLITSNRRSFSVSPARRSAGLWW
jgi:hypothetical protein